jgi:hypothetical protein
MTWINFNATKSYESKSVFRANDFSLIIAVDRKPCSTSRILAFKNLHKYVSYLFVFLWFVYARAPTVDLLIYSFIFWKD